MKKNRNVEKESLLASVKPSKAIVDMAVPATLALLAKAVYNIVDTAYIGMLNSDIALAAVGVTLPLLLIMVSIENIFAAGAGVLAGRQLGENDKEEANRTVTTIVGFSVAVVIGLCIGGIIFEDVLLRAFGASETVLPQAEDYAFWMFIAALFNLPAQSLNCAARAESSVRISSIAVITGAVLNVILDPVFMFSWGLDMGVEGASLATTISQCVTFVILLIFYMGCCFYWNTYCSDSDLPCSGHFFNKYCSESSSGCRFDHYGLWCGAASGFDRVLCDHGIYAGISAGSLLCFWGKK